MRAGDLQRVWRLVRDRLESVKGVESYRAGMTLSDEAKELRRESIAASHA